MATFQTFQAVGNREDLSDLIANISPLETPMWSGFAKTKASGVYHEWTQDSLTAAAQGNVVEGSDATDPTLTPRVRVGNYCQSNRKVVKVSDLQDTGVVKAGIKGSEYTYQLTKSMKEIARDMEYSIINGTGNSGAAATAREITGLPAFITTNTSTAGTARALTETIYNDMLQTIFDAGGNPDTTYANGFQKRQISSFTASQTRNIQASDKKLIASVDVYESDFGLQRIILDRYATADEIFLIEKAKWCIAILSPVKATELARTGSAKKGMLEGTWTLEAKHEGSGGKVQDLTTS